MPQGVSLTVRQQLYIRDNVKNQHLDDIADYLKIHFSTAYAFCYRNNLNYTRRPGERKTRAKEKSPRKQYIAKRVRNERISDFKPPMKRPVAVYTNSPSPYGIADVFHGRSISSS